MTELKTANDKRKIRNIKKRILRLCLKNDSIIRVTDENLFLLRPDISGVDTVNLNYFK